MVMNRGGSVRPRAKSGRGWPAYLNIILEFSVLHNRKRRFVRKIVKGTSVVFKFVQVIESD